MTNTPTPTPGTLAAGANRWRTRPGVPKPTPSSLGPDTDATGLDDPAIRAAAIRKADNGDMASAALVSAFYGRKARLGHGQAAGTP